MGLIGDLKSKVLALREKYGNMVVEHGTIIESADEALYHSMQRWHNNIHMESTDWIVLFEKVKHNLEFQDLEFKQNHNVCLSLLKKKYRKTNLKEQLSVSDIFPDALLGQIKLFYDEEVLKSHDEFEFDLTKKSREALFYSQTFLPVAIFSTYKEKFTGAEDEILFTDCFSLGAGSKRQDLIPEVHAYCDECYDFQSEERNRFIFVKQVENEFCLYGYLKYTDSDSESDCAYDKDDVTGKESDAREENKDVSDNDHIDENIVFNPWSEELSEVSESEKSSIVDLPFNSPVRDTKKCMEKPFSCEFCAKLFSKEHFVGLHCSIFHKRRKVVAEYVNEPEELITSFCVESDKNANSGTKRKSLRGDIIKRTEGTALSVECRRSGRLLSIKKSLEFND